MPFRAPVEDLRFALEVAGLPEVVAAGYPDADAETVAAMLEAAGAFATDVLAPLNRSGDVAGARFENGRVFAAPGFAQAYRAYADGGWTSLAAAPAHGGQGLPKAVSIARLRDDPRGQHGFRALPHAQRSGHGGRSPPTAPSGRRRCTCRGSSPASGRAR